ncbi:TetR/AcrR family transcriptional regulator [Gordonia sp. 'Campus']|uniref:TetR/AcrR family transcriptional regulator n=1 Tax=Gordonia sp. 'Campus' TaxID=2915824 RepID=UPI001EE3A833|nr:TetR/AcrR family transcriptional regulator [Gordonia sp. 'Campus']
MASWRAMASSLRAKQRQRVRRDIDAAALGLFAERGYAAVTGEEIARAAGISPSTYYRYVPTKDDLLLRPLRASSAAIVAGFASQAEELGLADALIAAVRTQTADVDAVEMRKWRAVVADVPEVIARVALIGSDDRARLIGLAGERMSLDTAVDLRPGVMVSMVLAIVEYAYQRWLTSDDETVSLLDVIDSALAASILAEGAQEA